jgi:hypothetical protein
MIMLRCRLPLIVLYIFVGGATVWIKAPGLGGVGVHQAYAQERPPLAKAARRDSQAFIFYDVRDSQAPESRYQSR